MFRRLCARVLMGLVLLVSVGEVTAAQTPVAEVPMSCTTEPVGMLSLLAVLNDVEEAQFAPSITTVPISAVIPGTSISAEDMQGITATTTELVGCANTLQVFSAIALLTDRFQSRLIVEVMEGNGMDELAEELPILAEETAATEGIQAIPIREAWYADSGNKSIKAILEPVASDPTQQRSFLVTYVFSIDRWLIDDVQLITGS